MTDNIRMYHSVINGERKIFPANYWVGEDGKQRALECMHYLIEDVLKYEIPRDI